MLRNVCGVFICIHPPAVFLPMAELAEEHGSGMGGLLVRSKGPKFRGLLLAPAGTPNMRACASARKPVGTSIHLG